MAKVHFFSEGIAFKVPHPRITASWIEKVARQEKAAIKSIQYIFCTDNYLLQINKDFLNHSTYTDIITFDYSEGKAIEAEIYISVERVKENASKFKTTFENELRRVIIHGVLHLVGYGDKTPAKKALMRKKEEACLSLLK
jgi:probable rRNA maturation factor